MSYSPDKHPTPVNRSANCDKICYLVILHRLFTTDTSSGCKASKSNKYPRTTANGAHSSNLQKGASVSVLLDAAPAENTAPMTAECTHHTLSMLWHSFPVMVLPVSSDPSVITHCMLLQCQVDTAMPPCLSSLQCHPAFLHCNATLPFFTAMPPCLSSLQCHPAFLHCNATLPFFTAMPPCLSSLQCHPAFLHCNATLPFFTAMPPCLSSLQCHPAFPHCNATLPFLTAMPPCLSSLQCHPAFLHYNATLPFFTANWCS